MIYQHVGVFLILFARALGVLLCGKGCLRFSTRIVGVFIIGLVALGRAETLNGGSDRGKGQLVSLRLRDADLGAVVGLLEQYTGRVVLRPDQLPTVRISLEIETPISMADAVNALTTTLALHQIGVTLTGDKFLKLVPLAQVKGEAPVIIPGSSLELTPSGLIATKLFKLKGLRLADVMPQMQGILTPGIGGNCVGFDKSNTMLVTDTISNIQRIEYLLSQLDRPILAKVYTLHYTKPSDLAGRIKAALSSSNQQQLLSAATVSGDDASGQIIVVCEDQYQSIFDDLVKRLDVNVAPYITSSVIYLKFATAKDVTGLLTSIIAGRTAAQAPVGIATRSKPQSSDPSAAVKAGEKAAIAESPPSKDVNFSGHISIQADERSNAVVISGTESDIRFISKLVEELDVGLAQVRIEVVIAEVDLEDNDASGITSLGLQIQGNKLVGFSGATADLSATGSGGSNLMTITRGASGAGGPWNLAGMLSLGITPRKTKTIIRSAPSITTTHNREASVFVGETLPVITASQSIPISSGTTTNLATSSTVVQENIGISLRVKPLVGSNDTVQMEINQEVSEEGGTVLVDNNQQPIVLRRTANSFIVAHSGDIIVLGGLQTKNNTKQTNRLGPIPFIGDLLGPRSSSNSRTELIFFVRATVVHDLPMSNESLIKSGLKP